MLLLKAHGFNLYYYDNKKTGEQGIQHPASLRALECSAGGGEGWNNLSAYLLYNVYRAEGGRRSVVVIQSQKIC